MKRQSGFTLIEILVVITIIGILASLSFPAIQGALEAAKKAEAGAMVSQLKTALTSYQTEYGVWPTTLSGGSDKTINGGDIYDILIGNDNASNDNPRRIVFMEFSSKSLRAGSASYSNKTPPSDLSKATTFVDPWNQEYRIMADGDYNNQITPVSGVTVNASVAVWSTGKPKGTTANTTVSKFIKSW